MNLLETSHCLLCLPAYARGGTKRLIKLPKLSWSDTGFALFLAGLEEPTGTYLKKLGLTAFVAGRKRCLDRTEVHYWRTAAREVNFVVENGGHLMPVEVKATSCARLADAASFSLLRAEYGEHAQAGVLASHR